MMTTVTVGAVKSNMQTRWFPEERRWITIKRDAQGRYIHINWITKPNARMLRKTVKKFFRIHQDKSIWNENDDSFMKRANKMKAPH